MTSENSSESTNSLNSPATKKVCLEHHAKELDRSELQNLLQRCRDNLIKMDSLLLDLEQAGMSLALATSEGREASDVDETAQTSSTTPTENSGGDSIRRIANDIESLCQSTSTDDTREMLNLIQSRMARCLRLLPSGR